MSRIIRRQISFGNRNATGKIEDTLVKIKSGALIHTLREDPNNDLKAGVKINLMVAPDRYHKTHAGNTFIHGRQNVTLRSDNVNVFVTVEGRLLMGADMVKFYRNEGFNSLDDFLNWYIPICKRSPEQTIKRKLIHWTDFRY